jgi:hypothetical protein
MTPASFRKLALSLEGALEGAHGGHRDFRAGGKVFASLARRHQRPAGRCGCADDTKRTHHGMAERECAESEEAQASRMRPRQGSEPTAHPEMVAVGPLSWS